MACSRSWEPGGRKKTEGKELIPQVRKGTGVEKGYFAAIGSWRRKFLNKEKFQRKVSARGVKIACNPNSVRKGDRMHGPDLPKRIFMKKKGGGGNKCPTQLK